MFTAQLILSGGCKQSDIVRVFGVSASSVKRSVAKYRQGGVAAFFASRAARACTVMTKEVTAQAQQLLAAGWSRREVADELGIKVDTLRKAIQDGRVTEPCQQEPTEEGSRMESASSKEPSSPTDKSARAAVDVSAEMGTACTRPDERVMASFGVLNGAPTKFESCRDVSFGGVLCALPALAENGLFRYVQDILTKLSGYYTTLHVITLLAHMALCRIKTVEQLQYESPGELGKLLGLDRVPEVRCLRQKLEKLSSDDGPEKWAAQLSRDWMESHQDLAGALYVDGHVRLYHGSKTQLPRRYVSRMRLCLRGTTDYWVNDALGQPFFYVERPVDHGMLEALENDIVPRLLQDVPRQPTKQQLRENRYLCRFVIVFDREGYSPAFFKKMWQEHRIACITYHKHPKENWPEKEFFETEVDLPNGERITMRLAEMGTWIGSRKDGLWVREVRKLTSTGHQVSLISTEFAEQGTNNAARLFGRWGQENFFRYMMQHFAIDAVNEYRTEEIPDLNRPVVNPRWRELDRDYRSVKGKLVNRQSRFAALTLHPETDEEKLEKWQKRKADLLEQVQQLEHQIEKIQQQLKQTPKHIEWEQMPEADKFEKLAPSRKRLVDTVKMIAYRAETALAILLRESLKREDDARSLLRDLFRSDADLLPDEANNVLRVQIHPMANPRSNRAIAKLLEHLNETEFTYPGTQLKLVFSITGIDE